MATDKSKDILDFNREVSMMFLRHTTGLAVRTPRGQKDPGTMQWDPKNNTREKSMEAIGILEKNNDNLGVHLFGPLVDVDIDTDNPIMIAALDRFLPQTSHVWGRASRPRTHRLYEIAGMDNNFDPSQWPFLEKIKNKPELATEVRGGDLKSARYSLLPGSIHPSGEEYRWENPKAARSTVTSVSETRLMQGVRFACVVALIAPHFNEGIRHHLCQAFSGFMFRASAYSEELNNDLEFTKEDAWELMQGVMDIADDDESDATMRRKTFEQTWEKGENGTPITGASRIQEITGDDTIVSMLYNLLANTPDLQALDAIFDQFAIIRNTTSLLDLKLGRQGNYVMNKEAFVFTMAGNYLTTTTGRVPISAVFLNSPRRTIVDRTSVNPSREKVYTDRLGLRVANLWTGWGIDPAEEEVHDSEMAWFTDYLLKVAADGDEGLFQWMLMWIADVFQNPTEKPGTALVMVGKPGAGKSLLMEDIIRPIIGDAHSTKVSTLDKLTGKFNSHMGGQLLIQGEEVMNTNRKSDADILKDAVTSKMRMVEMKGRDAFEMEDNARYAFTSNHIDRSVNVESGDRRYTISHVSDMYAFSGGKNIEARNAYFGALFSVIKDKDEFGEEIPNAHHLARLHRWLLGVKVDKNKIRVSYETKIKRATQQNASKGIDSWLLSMVDRVNPFGDMRPMDRGDVHSFRMTRGKLATTDGWPEYVQYSKLELSLRLFTARDYGEAKSAQQIAKFFKDEGMIETTKDRQTRAYGERVRVRPFPPRHSIIEYLTSQGYEVMNVMEDDSIDDEDEDGDVPQY